MKPLKCAATAPSLLLLARAASIAAMEPVSQESRAVVNRDGARHRLTRHCDHPAGSLAWPHGADSGHRVDKVGET